LRQGFTLYPRLSSNPWSSWLCLSNAEIIVMRWYISFHVFTVHLSSFLKCLFDPLVAFDWVIYLNFKNSYIFQMYVSEMWFVNIFLPFWK
jgi:hypothetical protein